MIKKSISILCTVIILMTTIIIIPEKTEAASEMRGVWIASVYNIDFPKKQNLTSKQMMSEIDIIINNAKKWNLNSIFFQVRPMSDSLYKSKIFPWSKYLTGVQGKAPDNNFDPLNYIIKKAHENGLELHAWINPYRVCKTAELSSLAANHPAKLHPDWTVSYADDMTYFNPAIPEVRQLITDGINEIAKNYDVDGIHMDDYFYPDKKTITDSSGNQSEAVFDDKDEYAKYGSGMSLDNFRRNNVNLLVKNIRPGIRKINKNIKFGISPFGVWANKSSMPEGSDTKGNQSYSAHYADTRMWVKSNWLDYIAPQLYWSFDFDKCKYDVLTSWWDNVCRGTDVDLYIGHAAYKIPEWGNCDEIIKQIDYSRKKSSYKGSIFYGYSDLVSNTLGICDKLSAKYNDNNSPPNSFNQDNKLTPNDPSDKQTHTGDKQGNKAEQNTLNGILDTKGKLKITSPVNNYKTTSGKLRITGYADPANELLMNGSKIEMSASGYFGAYVDLNMGKNTFTFKNAEREIIYTAVRENELAAAPLSEISFVKGTLFPQNNKFYTKDDLIELSVSAPAKSRVSAYIFGKTYMLEQAENGQDNIMYPVKYKSIIKIPDYIAKDIDIKSGVHVKYSLSNGGKTVERESEGIIGIITKKQSAVIKEDNVIIKPRASDKTFPEVVPVNKTAVSNINQIDGDYYRVSDNGYVHKNSVDTVDKSCETTVIKSSYIKRNTQDETLIINMNVSPLYKIRTDNEKIYVSIMNNSLMSNIFMSGSDVQSEDITGDYNQGNNKLIKSVNTYRRGTNVIYAMTPDDMQNVAGIESSYKGNNLYIKIKKKKSVSDDKNKPLSGIKVIVDAGHGDTPGAYGPAGADGPVEKNITLSIAKRVKSELESAGANVIMSRSDDSFVELADRTKLARDAGADIFLSIHLNSVDFSASPFATGVNTYYTTPFSKKLSEDCLGSIASGSFLEAKSIHYQNFAVTRDYFTPAVLLELGYICNPFEYEELLKDENLNNIASGIKKGVIKYFN